MEAVIFIGIQASGKTTFYLERFFKTHVRINLDMLKTRHREKILLEACLEMKQPFVVDNTSPAREDRRKYIKSAKSRSFRVIGYYFDSEIEQAIKRNNSRPEKERIPVPGIKNTHSRLEFPEYSEGFDELYSVTINRHNEFEVNRKLE